MTHSAGTCPMTTRQLVDEYFIENRTKLIDIASFLDRLDRSLDQSDERDFRMKAFLQALEVLASDSSSRVQKIQMILSDPTTEPLDGFDLKSARGAYEPKKEVS
jgi:hypothetical protein